MLLLPAQNSGYLNLTSLISRFCLLQTYVKTLLGCSVSVKATADNKRKLVSVHLIFQWLVLSVNSKLMYRLLKDLSLCSVKKIFRMLKMRFSWLLQSLSLTESTSCAGAFVP